MNTEELFIVRDNIVKYLLGDTTITGIEALGIIDLVKADIIHNLDS